MIGKPRPNGMRQVFVYDPQAGRKRYVGQRASLTEARQLEAAKTVEFSGTGRSAWTVDAYAQRFLDVHHTRDKGRPAPTTRTHNEQMLRPFRDAHGRRLLAGFPKDIATDWAATRPNSAQVVKAMFNEALREDFCPANPFAALRIKSGRGRKDIDPLTEAEVEQLANIALRSSGHYGPELWALILFLAWTGIRPGEACALHAQSIDWETLRVDVRATRRNDGTLAATKGKRSRTIPLADEPAAAVRTLRRTTGPLFRSPTGKPLRPNSIRHYWVPVRAAFTASLPDDHWLRRRLLTDPSDQLDPYELRHFCGSMLADRGYNATDIAGMLGNTARVCEDTYIHAHRDRQIERLREGLNRPAAPDPRTVGQPVGKPRTA